MEQTELTHGRKSGVEERVMERLYARMGPRIVWVLFGFLAAVNVTAASAAATIPMRSLGSDQSEVLALTLGLDAVVIVCLFLLVASLRADLQHVLAWTPDAESDQAGRTWLLLTALPLRAARLWTAIVTPPLWIWCAVMIAVIHRPAWVWLPVTAAGTLCLLMSSLIVMFTLEIGTRTILAEVDTRLPLDFTVSGSAGPGLGAKTVVPAFVFTAVTAIGAGQVSDIDGSPATRYLVTVLVALLLATIVGFFFWVASRSILAPLGQLTAATERLRRGDFGVHVPIVGTDDLGVLAASFNEMVLGLRDSQARIVTASDAARKAVERDLHDGAQQRLVLVRLQLAQVQHTLMTDPERGQTLLAAAISELTQGLAELRDLAHGIFPSVLVTDGLRSALTEATTRIPRDVTLSLDGVERLDPDVEAAIYFCCLEAMQNTVKHAGDAARLNLRVVIGQGTITFSVADDGRGVDTNVQVDGAGLQNIRDRVGALGGRAWVESAPGRGTTVRGEIPVR